MRQTLQLSEIIDSLIEILNLEKARLMQGDYNDLEDITQKKAFYCSALNAYFENPAAHDAVRPFHDKIRTIKTLANQNAALFEAAKSGVSSAKARLNNILNEEKSVGTYTACGDKLQTHDTGVTKCKLA